MGYAQPLAFSSRGLRTAAMAIWTLSAWLHRTSLWCTHCGWSPGGETKQDQQGTWKRWGQGEGTPDRPKLRRQGALGCWDLVEKGPPHIWRSWERGQSWPRLADRWHWSWWDPGPPCTMLTRRPVNLRFFIYLWELTPLFPLTNGNTLVIWNGQEAS